MYITSLKADGFKNLTEIDINPHKKVNVLFGKNAQGKTNLLESIWLLSGARSFRGTKDKDMYGRDRHFYNIGIEFFDGQRIQKIEVDAREDRVGRERKISLNGVGKKSMKELFGEMPCVVFTPDDLEISKGSPEIRRDFMDLSISQLKLSYDNVMTSYEGVLHQRNALLKSLMKDDTGKEMLAIYNGSLAMAGSYITSIRFNYIRKLSKIAGDIYNRISGGREQLTLSYLSTVFERLEGWKTTYKEMAGEYHDALIASRDNDIRTGFTSVGIHRDDIIARIDGMPAREYASQGQHRSIALSLKLAQAYIIAQEKENAPIILLDDILSELDKERQEFVLSQIDNMQVFITCCDKIPPLDIGTVYNIENGRII